MELFVLIEKSLEKPLFKLAHAAVEVFHFLLRFFSPLSHFIAHLYVQRHPNCHESQEYDYIRPDYDNQIPIHNVPLFLHQQLSSFFFLLSHKGFEFCILSLHSSVKILNLCLNRIYLRIQVPIIRSSHPQKRSNRHHYDKKLYPFHSSSLLDQDFTTKAA